MKKPKSYYSNYDSLCQAWVEGTCADDAHVAKHRMFVNGDAIYSYGTHFTMARRVKTDKGRTLFLLTTRRYSPTTSNHLNTLSWALPSDATVELPQVDRIDHLKTEADIGQAVLEDAINILKEQHQKYLRMIRPHSCPVGYYETQQRRLDMFGLTLPPECLALLEDMHKHKAYRDERNNILDIQSRLTAV